MIWTAIAADANDEIWGITHGMPGPDDLVGSQRRRKLYVTSDPLVFVLDHASGSIIGRQPLDKTVDEVEVGPYLIYSTRTGQVMWHQYVVGHPWRANQLRGPVVPPPPGRRQPVVCGSDGGTVLMLDGKTVGRIWGDQSSAASSRIASGDGMIFCPSDDQYLRAYDAGTGRLMWKHLARVR